MAKELESVVEKLNQETQWLIKQFQGIIVLTNNGLELFENQEFDNLLSVIKERQELTYIINKGLYNHEKLLNLLLEIIEWKELNLEKFVQIFPNKMTLEYNKLQISLREIIERVKHLEGNLLEKIESEKLLTSASIKGLHQHKQISNAYEDHRDVDGFYFDCKK